MIRFAGRSALVPDLPTRYSGDYEVLIHGTLVTIKMDSEAAAYARRTMRRPRWQLFQENNQDHRVQIADIDTQPGRDVEKTAFKVPDLRPCSISLAQL